MVNSPRGRVSCRGSGAPISDAPSVRHLEPTAIQRACRRAAGSVSGIRPATRSPESAAAHIHTIDGLTERFVVWDDDQLLGRPIEPHDFDPARTRRRMARLAAEPPTFINVNDEAYDFWIVDGIDLNSRRGSSWGDRAAGQGRDGQVILALRAPPCRHPRSAPSRSHRPVRVLYTVTAFSREPGDVITPWLVEMIDRLRARGVEVEVLAPAWRGLGDQRIGDTQVHRFRYAPRALETLTHEQTAPDRVREKPAYLGLVPGYVAAGALAAARLARTGRFDVVHTFWPLPHGIWGLAARRAGAIPLVSTFFGVELTWVRSKMPFFAPLLRAVIRRSDAVTAISSHTAGEVRRLVPDARVRVIPFGAAIAPAGAPPPVRRTASRPFRLLFTGRLVERKGVDVLLRALALLGAERDVRLAIVGDGPLRAGLAEQAAALGLSGRVEFTGFVAAGELTRRLEQCDALVLPAIEDAKGDVEGLGVVLIEALLHSRPVIASASGGIPDIVLDGRTGLLVPPGDAPALAAAIARLLDDPALAARLAEDGRAYVADRFSWDAIVTDVVGVYESVCASST